MAPAQTLYLCQALTSCIVGTVQIEEQEDPDALYNLAQNYESASQEREHSDHSKICSSAFKVPFSVRDFSAAESKPSNLLVEYPLYQLYGRQTMSSHYHLHP